MAQTETAQLTSQPAVLPASFAQQRMWFLDRLESGSSAYNVPLTSRLRGPLDVDALERGLGALVERHESLRTGFELVDGIPQQVIHPPRPVRIELTDVTGAADPERDAAELAGDSVRERFDLASDRLFRVALIKVADDDHVFSLTLHHIITDAWSMGVISRELGSLYAAFVEGESLELPELEIQYADFAVWQQQWMESGGLDAQLGYWQRKLAGAPTLLELPTDKPRPAEQSFRGATLRRVLEPELLSAVKAFGEREGATMFMTLLAAFMTLLARYSGQDDLVVATPVANRGRVELEQIVGLLVNTLALRVEVDDDPSFSELLHRVRETSLDGFSNQDLPFEKLVQELNPERSRSHAPVAQVMFVHQTATEKPLALAGLSHERLMSDRGTAKFDLALFAGEVRDGLRVAIEYCSDLFEAGTIERMLEHFRVLLSAAVAQPEVPISRLSMLPDDERSLVLERWGDASAGAADERCVHEWVAEQAALTPDATAVVSGSSGSLTYAELSDRADRLAARLRSLGVGPDSVVAISAERSLETVIGVLATLKAGGAYAPVDPAYPAERIAFMLADSGATVVLTQTHLVDSLPEHSAQVICLDAPDEGVLDVEAGPEPTPDNLAYVIYTSGSTGLPKGVAMPHRPLSNLLSWQRSSLREPVAARTLQFASLSFDVAFQEIFSTWSTGGTLVLIDENVRRDPHALLSVLADREVERLFLPYVALQALCEAAEHTETALPRLREVITAGEQLKVTAPVSRFFRRHPGCTLFNHYGPSETHVVTSHELAGDAALWPALPPIGRPISGARTYVLDRHREPVAIGVPGELYLGGVTVARGYLGRPELTAERFVADPFAGAGTMYRTGDLARWSADGTIAFLGRADDQVKVRGFRVELGEVEAMLTQHPGVAEAVVMLREDTPGDVRLVAYVVPREGQALDDLELISHARRRVPDYMVPQHFVILDAVPLTPSGKLDRRALPAPEGRNRSDAELAMPSTELERALAEIWQRLLRVDRVGIDEDFFDLGGHSLLAVQVVHAIEDELGRTCTLPMLFRNGTIRELAAELHAGGVDATEPVVLELAHGTGPALFCICGVHVYQELAEELAPDYSVYGVFLPIEQELFRARSRWRAPKRLSVRHMAGRYVEVVRELQPHGPYLLLGFCFGGVLAYEAARQLRDAGEEVSMVVMLDSTLGSILRRRRRTPLKHRLRASLTRHYDVLPSRLQRRLMGPAWDTDRELKRLDMLRGRIYGDAMASHTLSPYGGRAVLVRPEASARAYSGTVTDPTWGWGGYVEDLTVFNVPGHHLSHLHRPAVHALGRALRPHLDRAAANHEAETVTLG